MPRRIVCDADAAVDWVFDLESGIIRTTARSAARARIALAEEATSDPPFERDGEGLAFVRLPAGFHTLQINPPSALKAALAPALEAARGLPEGTPGAAQESGPPRSAQQGFRAVAAYDSDSPILDAWLAASDGAEAALLLCLDDGRLISLLPTGEAREAGRFEPGAARIRPLDLDLDGRPEWALGMRDGFIRALNADFEEIGAIDLNAGKNDHAAIRELEAMDFEGDGLPDLAILLGAQRLVLVDSLGRIVGERIFPEPIQVFAPGDLESDGRPEIALGGAQGMRAIARLDIGGLREVVELPRAAGAVGAAAFFPLVGTGRSAVVFADFSGQISAFEGGGANDPFAQIWAVQAGQGPIRCLAAAPVSAPGLLAVGSEDGLFAVIDSSGTMSKPQLLGSPLAALAASSDAAGSATEWLALCENKRLYAARSDRPARDWIDLSPAMDTPPRRLCAQESSGAAVFVIGEKSAAVVRREFR